jgi:hypothetical protein
MQAAVAQQIPHVTLLQQFVRTDDLDKIYAAANAVHGMDAEGDQILLYPGSAGRSAGIVVELTEDLHRLHDELITAVEPYTVKAGTPAAFFSDEGGRDIQNELIDYVASFVTNAAGKRFNPHVTISIGMVDYLNPRSRRGVPAQRFNSGSGSARDPAGGRAFARA